MDATFAPPKSRFSCSPLAFLLPILLWVLLLAFAPLPINLSPQLWLDEALSQNGLARIGVAFSVALAALTSLWARRFQWDFLLVGAAGLALFSAFSALHDGTLMALVAAAWWLAFFAALWLSPDDRALLLQFCLVAFGIQVVATLGAYFLGYQPFITPRFGARAGGMMGSPNQIYPWSLIWIGLFWAAAQGATSPQAKRWLHAGALGSVAVLLLTFSRAGWIGFALVLPFVWPRPLQVKSRSNWLPYALAGLLLLGAATIRTRGEILSTQNDGSTRGRARIYQISWRLFQEKPLLGHGVGQIARRDDLEIDFVEPKNIYAQFALEHGVVGLALFGVFITGILARVRRILDDKEADFHNIWAARALLLALPMLLVAGCFDSPIFGHFERIVPTIAFLLLAGLVVSPTPGERVKEPLPSPTVKEKSLHDSQQVEHAFLRLNAEMTQNGVTYFVIGSCARLAYLQNFRPVSDIDILIFGAANRRRAAPILKRVSDQTGVLVEDSLSRFFECKNGAFFLVYGLLRVPVEAKVFERRDVMWHSARLPTFAPQTLLHFFNCLVATPLRIKDKPNVYEFARFVSKRREFDHALYFPFHYFVGRWRYFPLRVLQLGWRLVLRRASPKLRLWVLKSYETAPSRALRTLLNAVVPFVFVRLSVHQLGRSRWGAKGRRRAFTLIEILVVTGIFALLLALLFPVFSQARERGRRTTCTAMLADFGRAFHLYAQDYDGLLPNPGGRGMQKNGDLPAVDAADNGAAWYSPGQVVDSKITDRGALVSYMGRLQNDSNNAWSCPNAMDAASPYGNSTRAIGQSYTMNDYLRAAHPGAGAIREQGVSGAFNPSYHTGVSLSQVGAGDGHSGADVILLFEAVQRNSGSVNRNGSPYWGRDWLSRYGMEDLPQGAPEEYHQGLSNFLFCDGHVKALRPTQTWTPKTQNEVEQLNPSYAKARGGRSGIASVDTWNPRLSRVKYP